MVVRLPIVKLKHHRDVAQNKKYWQPTDGHELDALFRLLALIGIVLLLLFVLGLAIGSAGLAITAGILTGLMLTFFIVTDTFSPLLKGEFF
ncbi:hypothetical protein [Hymenobacter psychrophilus]|uniref:hypothetical protein n=1 Tax=Hymenobacter psychrophilus TaxID=651662 RepID=UPI001114B11B|nr:hypothetical protein [Hymenobacter psychrophilus]